MMPRVYPSSASASFILVLFVFVALVFNNDTNTNCQGVLHPLPRQGSIDHSNNEYPLTSGISIPLVGMGIGNLAHDSIPSVVRNQLAQSSDNGGGRGIRLIDTASASNNEEILSRAIESAGLLRSLKRTLRGNSEDDDDDAPIHIVTKVWYTHLGYERTKLSVTDSLQKLQQQQSTTGNSSSKRLIYVHLLLHWPRCDDTITWMNCEEEENNLPIHVKNIGPPPHLDKNNAYKGSWKALEDVYFEREQLVLQQQSNSNNRFQLHIGSIGVSNFNIDDMKQLISMARVIPHIYQGDSWLVLHDPLLMDLLFEHKIFFQAYSIFERALKAKDETPRAYEVLSGIANEISAKVENVTEATVLLAYFNNYDIGVIPRSSSTLHQIEISPQTIASAVPHLTPLHISRLEKAISALMKRQDLDAVQVSFVNALSSAIQIHWIHPDTNEELLVSNTVIHPGSKEIHETHPGHRFVAYDPNRLIRKEYIIDVKYGEKQIFNVEL